MKKTTLAFGAITALCLLAGVTSVGTASADGGTAPSGTGFDATPDVATGGGSDTTYLVSQRLESLYNATPGCSLDTASGSVNKGKCLAATTGTATSKLLSGNLGVITLTSPQGFVPTQSVTVALSPADPVFDGTKVINAVVGSTLTVTTVTEAAGVSTFNVSNSLAAGQPIIFSSAGGTNVVPNTVYFVKSRTGSSFTLSAVQNGTVLGGLTGAGGSPVVPASIYFNKTNANVAATATAGTLTSIDPAPVTGNFDHDVVASAAPIGSGAGVNALIPGGVAYNPGINYARSSRANSGTELDSTTFWGYARDGIAVTTFGSRNQYKLSTADLQAIYTCAKTDWSQIFTKNANGTDTTTPYPAGQIIAWDMNASSGTFATFQGFVTTNFGPCVRKLITGVAPFENDVKPILADPGPDEQFNTADDDENNYIWWQSFGNWTTYAYAKNGCINGAGTVSGITGAVTCTTGAVNSNLVTVDNTDVSATTVADGSYVYTRTLYQVTKNTDADCRQAPGTGNPVSGPPCDNVGTKVYGATSGKGGAVRQFTEFLCKTANNQSPSNPVTGRGYFTEITSVLNSEGFQRVPAADRTAGYACKVLT